MDDNSSSGDNAQQLGVSEATANYQNKNVVLPDCTDLDWAQIIYVINYKRLLFAHLPGTWSKFHTENCDNGIKYIDYTTEELSHRFLERVLPNIFEYELTEDEFHLLNLLDLHPNFERTSTGFNNVEGTEGLSFPWDESATKMLITTETLENEPRFVGSDAISNTQILTVGPGRESSVRRKFNFNEENAALLSVALCSNEELPNCELLSTEEIFKRLKSAKSEFENNGSLPENVNISIDEFFKKIETLSKLKKAVTKLVNSSSLFQQTTDS